MDIAAHPFLCAMVDYLVLLHVLGHPIIDMAIVGVNRIWADCDIVFDLVDYVMIDVLYVVFAAQAATLSLLFRPCKVVVCMEPSDS